MHTADNTPKAIGQPDELLILVYAPHNAKTTTLFLRGSSDAAWSCPQRTHYYSKCHRI